MVEKDIIKDQLATAQRNISILTTEKAGVLEDLRLASTAAEKQHEQYTDRTAKVGELGTRFAAKSL